MRKQVNTFCRSCGSNTNHAVLFCKAEIQTDDTNPEFVIKTQYEYMTIECAGCNTVSFLERGTFLEPSTDEPPMSFDTNYPEFSSEYNFLADEDIDDLPKPLKKLYNEIIRAFAMEAEILSGLGLRALVEAICIEQKVEGTNLQKKIVALKEQGLISTNEVPILDKLRVIGNVAAHQIKGLPLNTLSYALDIINHVLTSIYILPKINKRINIR